MPHRTENIPVEATTVVCDGDKDGKHPLVYLALNAEGYIDCPYCGRRYVLKERVSEDA